MTSFPRITEETNGAAVTRERQRLSAPGVRRNARESSATCPGHRRRLAAPLAFSAPPLAYQCTARAIGSRVVVTAKSQISRTQLDLE